MSNIDKYASDIYIDDKIFKAVAKAIKDTARLSLTAYASGGKLGEIIQGRYSIVVRSQKRMALIEMPIKILMEGDSE